MRIQEIPIPGLLPDNGLYALLCGSSVDIIGEVLFSLGRESLVRRKNDDEFSCWKVFSQFVCFPSSLRKVAEFVVIFRRPFATQAIPTLYCVLYPEKLRRVTSWNLTEAIIGSSNRLPASVYPQVHDCLKAHIRFPKHQGC